MWTAWRPGSARLARALRSAERSAFTYDEVGATTGVMPDGYHHIAQRTLVSGDPHAFTKAADALLAWGLHRAAGMSVAPSSSVAAPGVSVVSATPGPVALLVPCRVVSTIDEPDRRGFVYGTLPGHPLRGEERFTVEVDHAGKVWLHIVSFSSLIGVARLAPPLSRTAQWAMNRRFAAVAPRLVEYGDEAATGPAGGGAASAGSLGAATTDSAA